MPSSKYKTQQKLSKDNTHIITTVDNNNSTKERIGQNGSLLWYSLVNLDHSVAYTNTADNIIIKSQNKEVSTSCDRLLYNLDTSIYDNMPI